MEKISATLQAYNPTSGEYYAERMAVARELLDELLQRPSKNFTMEDLDGEWELVFSTVKHGIFRSSPFFLAVQEAFGNQESSELFFKLHELQVGSRSLPLPHVAIFQRIKVGCWLDSMIYQLIDRFDRFEMKLLLR